MRQGLLDYVIAPPTRSDESYWLDRKPDVFLTSISPPDDDGWCSFGMSVWGAPEVAREATHVIGEVNPRLHPHGRRQPRAYLALRGAGRSAAGMEVPAAAAANDEETEVAQVICSLVGARDRAGRRHAADGHRHRFGGARGVPVASPRPRRALGADLRRHPGARRAGRRDGRAQDACTRGRSSARRSGRCQRDEFAAVDGDPRYELYCMSHTNDIAVIAAHDNMVRGQQRAARRPDRADQRRDPGHGDLQRHGRRLRVRRRRAAREERPAVTVLPSTSLVKASGARASCRCSRREARSPCRACTRTSS